MTYSCFFFFLVGTCLAARGATPPGQSGRSLQVQQTAGGQSGGHRRHLWRPVHRHRWAVWEWRVCIWHFEVLFIIKRDECSVLSSDSGLVLKAIHLPREHGQSQEVTLEQMQVFQVLQTEPENILQACYFVLELIVPQIELIRPFFLNVFFIPLQYPFIPSPFKKIKLPFKTRSKCTLLSQHNAAQTFHISLRDNNTFRHGVTNSISVHNIWKWVEVHAFLWTMR